MSSRAPAHPWTEHLPPRRPAAALTRPPRLSAPAPIGEEWHTEANVQAFLVTALVSDGWRILSVANTATKEHGIDVIAARDGQTVGVEVKGFPSRGYADPTRSSEVKRTSPSTQAGTGTPRPSSRRCDCAARAGVAQRHRAARLPSLPRALSRDARDHSPQHRSMSGG